MTRPSLELEAGITPEGSVHRAMPPGVAGGSGGDGCGGGAAVPATQTREELHARPQVQVPPREEPSQRFRSCVQLLPCRAGGRQVPGRLLQAAVGF